MKGQRHLVKYFDRAENTPEDEEEIYEERLLSYKNPYKWKLLCRKCCEKTLYVLCTVPGKGKVLGMEGEGSE